MDNLQWTYNCCRSDTEHVNDGDLMDAGYNQHKNDEFTYGHGAQAIVPLN